MDSFQGIFGVAAPKAPCFGDSYRQRQALSQTVTDVLRRLFNESIGRYDTAVAVATSAGFTVHHMGPAPICDGKLIFVSP